MNYELKPLTLGSMIGKSFNIYFDNFVPLLLVTLITRIPSLLLQIFYTNQATVEFAASGMTGDSLLSFYGTIFITSILTSILSFFESGIIIKIVSKKYLNQEVVMQKLMKEFKPLILPLIGLSILLNLIMWTGFILLIIPGLIFTIALIISSEVMVVEGKGVIESLKRSWALTKKRRLRIFGYVFVMLIIVIIITQVSQYLLTQLISVAGIVGLPFISIVTYVIAAVAGPLFACFKVLIYFNMRIEKEGFDLEHLTSEFSLANADRADDPYL